MNTPRATQLGIQIQLGQITLQELLEEYRKLENELSEAKATTVKAMEAYADTKTAEVRRERHEWKELAERAMVFVPIGDSLSGKDGFTRGTAMRINAEYERLKGKRRGQ